MHDFYETTGADEFFSDAPATQDSNNSKEIDMKGTRQLVDEMTAQGFTLTRTYLAWVLRDRHIPEPERGPGGCFLWSEADAGRLRSFLLRQGRGPEQESRK